MYRIIICLLLATLQFAGCATMRHVETPDVEQNGKPNIYIIRNYNFWGSANYLWPTVNDKDIAGLLGKTYVEFYLPEGNFILGVRCFGGWLPLWTHDKIDVHITNEPQYFLISPALHICGEIEKISQDEGIKRISKSTKIKLGEIAECSGGETDHYCFSASYK